jgi:hypothetical protein
MVQVHIADGSDKTEATEGMDAWNLINVIVIEATIMSLTLLNQSMDHLQVVHKMFQS